MWPIDEDDAEFGTATDEELPHFLHRDPRGVNSPALLCLSAEPDDGLILPAVSCPNTGFA